MYKVGEKEKEKKGEKKIRTCEKGKRKVRVREKGRRKKETKEDTGIRKHIERRKERKYDSEEEI